MNRTYVIAPLLLALAACSSSSGGEVATDEVNGDDAAVMCQQFVEQRLKSPSSAEFETEDGIESKNAWTVQGAVDAENSFGAAMRSDFTCTLRYVGDGEWRLRDLTGLNG